MVLSSFFESFGLLLTLSIIVLVISLGMIGFRRKQLFVKSEIKNNSEICKHHLLDMIDVACTDHSFNFKYEKINSNSKCQLANKKDICNYPIEYRVII